MKERFNDFDSIKDVLKSLVESKVTIVLERGQKITLEVDAVEDYLLIGSICKNIIFVDIRCICAVVTCCEEVLEFFLNRGPKNFVAYEEGVRKVQAEDNIDEENLF